MKKYTEEKLLINNFIKYESSIKGTFEINDFSNFDFGSLENYPIEFCKCTNGFDPDNTALVKAILLLVCHSNGLKMDMELRGDTMNSFSTVFRNKNIIEDVDLRRYFEEAKVEMLSSYYKIGNFILLPNDKISGPKTMNLNTYRGTQQKDYFIYFLKTIEKNFNNMPNLQEFGGKNENWNKLFENNNDYFSKFGTMENGYANFMKKNTLQCYSEYKFKPNKSIKSLLEKEFVEYSVEYSKISCNMINMRTKEIIGLLKKAMK